MLIPLGLFLQYSGIREIVIMSGDETEIRHRQPQEQFCCSDSLG